MNARERDARIALEMAVGKLQSRLIAAGGGAQPHATPSELHRLIDKIKDAWTELVRVTPDDK